MRQIVILSLLAFSSTAFADREHVHAQKPDSPTFATLKKLSGAWAAQDDKGGKFTVTYAMTAADRCVKETLDLGQGGTMDTIYCDNGDHVIATHYCHSGNQPRLKSLASKDQKSITFDFLDATGMSSKDEGHMHKLVLDVASDDKIVQKWSYFEKGKEQGVSTFTLARKK